MNDPQDSGRKQPADHRRLHTRDEVRDAVAALFQQAQRTLVVFAPILDGYYFNTPAIGDLLGKFVATHRDNRVRILVEDALQIIRDDARLVRLAQRLPDCLQIREVSEEHRGFRDMFMVADHSGFLHQESVERGESILGSGAPHEAVQLTRRFDEMWELSEPIQELRATGL